MRIFKKKSTNRVQSLFKYIDVTNRWKYVFAMCGEGKLEILPSSPPQKMYQSFENNSRIWESLKKNSTRVIDRIELLFKCIDVTNTWKYVFTMCGEGKLGILPSSPPQKMYQSFENNSRIWESLKKNSTRVIDYLNASMFVEVENF